MVFVGKDGVLCNVVVIFLCVDGDVVVVIKVLNESVEVEVEIKEGCFWVFVIRFK